MVFKPERFLWHPMVMIPATRAPAAGNLAPPAPPPLPGLGLAPCLPLCHQVGIARRCLEVMNSYATDRKAFGSSLRDFGQVSGRTCGRRVGQVVQAASIETHH